MKLALRLTCQPTPPREASAYFVPGRCAEEWLAELIAWQAPLAKARLHVIPVSSGERTPCGVFVLGESPPASRRSPRALPYRVAAGRMYLPVDADLDPPLDDAELLRLLESDDTVYLWRPQTGLVELAASRSLAVSDLLLAPAADAQAWDCGVAGVALNARLFSIEPEATPTVENVLESARDDIGSEPLDLKQLPPAANEPLAGIGGVLGRGLMLGLAGALYGLTRLVPHMGAVHNWINKFEDWAGAKLNKLAQSLEASRHRELTRLLDLLRSNPDEGLRYALPMGGGDHRGLAPPSARLGRRNVDFSLNWFRGGGPADFWDLPAQLQQRLLTRYRELAAREIALGRHRRAAYIFATLLGDVKSAANTLADGGHWREAAVLYEERLKQPHEAARCLRQGGLWAEAIALYEKLGEHETVGDLYQQLDQRDEAERAWRRAVAACDARFDALAAASLLEHKIGRIDEAWQRLLAAWPRSPQAVSCMTEAFKLLGRHGWHDRAAALVDELIAEPAFPQPEAVVVEQLASQSLEYPDAAVREHAVDRTRVAAAERLENVKLSQDETRRIALAVGRLAPADRLLGRDAQRWLKQRFQPAAAEVLRGRPKAVLSQEFEFHLPALDWKTAVSTDDSLYAAGYRDREVVLVRVNWRFALDPRLPRRVPPSGTIVDELSKPGWLVEPKFVGRPILLAADPYGEAPTLVHVMGHASLPPRVFAANPRFPAVLMLAGGHRGLSAASVGLTYTGRATVDIADVAADAKLVVNAYLSADAQLLGLCSLDLSPAAAQALSFLPPAILTREETLFVGLGQELHSVERRHTAHIAHLPGAITQLIGSAPHTRPRIAAAMQQGGMIFWGENAAADRTPFASEMVEPRIALTRRGWLVAASKDEIDVYATAGGKLQLHARTRGDGIAPLAALATHNVNQFALLYPNGRVTIYQIPQS
ncbi:MAG TPA: hypothetical protein VMV10_14895 [Pirellulales bacterium]|nr:hypothetical protein [Pirellulales bacterium]